MTYRGTGDSRRQAMTGYNQAKSLVGFKASMSDWRHWISRPRSAGCASATRRCVRVCRALLRRPGAGAACQQHRDFARAVIAAQAGYWKLDGRARALSRLRLLNCAGVPLTTLSATRRVGWDSAWDLPKDVFLQWVSWVMSPRYLFRRQESRRLAKLCELQRRVRALVMSDDPWATRPAVELLCAALPRSRPRSSR